MIACMHLWSSEGGLRWKKVFMCGYNWDWDWRNADFATTTTPHHCSHQHSIKATLLCSWSGCRLRHWLDLTHISNILHECYPIMSSGIDNPITSVASDLTILTSSSKTTGDLTFLPQNRRWLPCLPSPMATCSCALLCAGQCEHLIKFPSAWPRNELRRVTDEYICSPICIPLGCSRHQPEPVITTKNWIFPE